MRKEKKLHLAPSRRLFCAPSPCSLSLSLSLSFRASAAAQPRMRAHGPASKREREVAPPLRKQRSAKEKETPPVRREEKKGSTPPPVTLSPPARHLERSPVSFVQLFPPPAPFSFSLSRPTGKHHSSCFISLRAGAGRARPRGAGESENVSLINEGAATSSQSFGLSSFSAYLALLLLSLASSLSRPRLVPCLYFLCLGKGMEPLMPWSMLFTGPRRKLEKEEVPR